MTFNRQSSSSSSLLGTHNDNNNNNGRSNSDAKNSLEQLAIQMDDRASSNKPFTETELQELQTSFYNIIKGYDGVTGADEMWNQLHDLFSELGHLSHKDWTRTGESSDVLTNILLPKSNNNSVDNKDELQQGFKHMFHRVLHEGNWDNALSHAKSNHQDNKPWAVLVTGVNGIRKTTSVYQSWFPTLLKEALIAPSTDNEDNKKTDVNDSLPTGHNSFFRQLDHMIATISNYNFQQLYELTSQSHDFHESSGSNNNSPSKTIIQNYSNYKASIFKRYRTLSEMLGITLINQAIDRNINVMIETSGRDVAMFHYIDKFFPAEKYNKLVLHFEINDLSHAESSVDRRMVREMEDGVKVLNGNNGNDGINVRDLINVNAGGPYGSEVLVGIQRDSDAVWDEIMKNHDDSGFGEEKKVGHDWYKASIKINASTNRDWTARAMKPDGVDGQIFSFEAPRQV